MKIIKKNKRVQFDYIVIKTFVAGAILLGPEVKEIKSGHINLEESYVRFHDEQLYLWNAFVTTLPADIKQDREKKLLLHKRELQEVKKLLEQKGYTMVPTLLGIDHGLIKVEIAVVKGKRRFDKRETIKSREADRAIRRVMLGKAEKRR